MAYNMSPKQKAVWYCPVCRGFTRPQVANNGYICCSVCGSYMKKVWK